MKMSRLLHFSPIASVCLFFVITAVQLGVQVFSPFGGPPMAILLALGALFAWRVYRSRIPYGWI